MRAVPIRALLWLSLVIVWGASGCAAAPLVAGPPPAWETTTQRAKNDARNLEGGLRVVEERTVPGEFVAGLLFRGGPLNDPVQLPGLTEWVVEAAVLGTVGRDPVTESPHQRALRFGGTIEPIATGAVAGWIVFGPRAHADELLDLLLDIALTPSFPATRLSMATAMNREALATREDALIERAIAIALGQSLGLGRPLFISPTAATFERVTLAHTERQWRGLVRPDHGVLVLLGGSELEALPVERLTGGWPSPLADGAQKPPRTCVPQGRTAHLLVTPGSFGEHTIALWGNRAPGWGLPGRRATEALMLHLDDRQGGPVEELVGAAQARRASPDVVDLGHIAGTPMAAVLVGAAGPPTEALEDLRRVDRYLTALGENTGITASEASGAATRLVHGERMALHRPFHKVLYRASLALGDDSGQPITETEMNAQASQVFAPWRSNLVLVGSTDLREPLEREAAVALWPATDDEPPPESPVRCLSEGSAP